MAAENKTTENDGDVLAFLHSVEHAKRREDGLQLLEIMQEITGMQPRMWGDAIVGFGSCHYRYDSGREGDMPLIAFSPRKQNLTLYVEMGFDGVDALMQKLGKFTTGKVCLYVKKLEDVDPAVLRELIAASFRHTQQTYPD